jgi:hypothetical protein
MGLSLPPRLRSLARPEGTEVVPYSERGSAAVAVAFARRFFGMAAAQQFADEASQRPASQR